MSKPPIYISTPSHASYWYDLYMRHGHDKTIAKTSYLLQTYRGQVLARHDNVIKVKFSRKG